MFVIYQMEKLMNETICRSINYKSFLNTFSRLEVVRIRMNITLYNRNIDDVEK